MKFCLRWLVPIITNVYKNWISKNLKIVTNVLIKAGRDSVIEPVFFNLAVDLLVI